MKTSIVFQHGRRWLLILMLIGSLAISALGLPAWLDGQAHSTIETPALAGPVVNPGGGGG